MNDLSQKVLGEIKEKKISPIPRWAFFFKNGLLWLIYILFLVVGGLAWAVIAFLIKNNDWDIYGQLYDGLFQFILLTVPYFWLIAMAGLILAAEYDFKHIAGAYRYHSYLVILASIIISLFLGAFFYHYGLEQIMHNVFVNDVPFYNNLLRPKQGLWIQPERGVLAGIVIVGADDGQFSLRDFDDQTWLVLIGDAHIRGGVSLAGGSRVKIIGQKIDDKQFQAQEIRPWIRACSDCSPVIQEKIR